MSPLKKRLVASVLCVATLLSLPLSTEAHGRSACCPPPPMQQVMLDVCHPKTGCTVHVPVCIPACCQGAPCVRCQRCLIGPGKVVFTWCCGYEVTVRFTCCGDYKVSTRG